MKQLALLIDHVFGDLPFGDMLSTDMVLDEMVAQPSGI